MDTSYVSSVRLTSFKSFTDQVLPLDELTLLVGRNGSGKSNALDGLWALARLAGGEDIRDALDGGRDAAVRGGTGGCAPFGQSSFSLGCSVRTGERLVDLDLTVQLEPIPQIRRERLSIDGQVVGQHDPPAFDTADVARWTSGAALGSRTFGFRGGRLLTPQLVGPAGASEADRNVRLAAAQVVAALRQVFVLDPVPHLMRGYVPERDSVLRADASNLSAALASLLSRPDIGDRLGQAMSQLLGRAIHLTSTRSDLGDVLLTLLEWFVDDEHTVPARLMSDGSLRFLAILVALLEAPTIDVEPEALGAEDAVGQTTLVIEELENGLHASQAQLLIGLIRDEVKRRRVRVLATAYSPALLDALHGDEHRSVVVCQRDEVGRSSLHRLVELTDYVGVVARGPWPLGRGRPPAADTAPRPDPLRGVGRDPR